MESAAVNGLMESGPFYFLACASLFVGGRERLQVSYDRFGILAVLAVLRHGRAAGQAVVGNSRHQEFDRLLVGPAGQSGDIGSLVGPDWHGRDRLDAEYRALQSFTGNGSALFIARCVAVSTHADSFGNIFTTRNFCRLRWRRGRGQG